MGTLFVVGTPIGNLEDVTLRALRILREVDLIAAEDTRTTRTLLRAYDITTPLVSFHEFTGPARTRRLAERLETGDVALSERVVESTRLWGISVSFGCVNSLISMPCRMSHASIPAEVRKARRLPEDLVRLCVGIEDCDDLLEDLDRALRIATASTIVTAAESPSTC